MEDFSKIIDACISGDNRVREKLYHLLAPKMFGVCMRYARDKSEAEDNLQDGFITVFTKLQDFRHEGSFEGWVRRIMVNVSVSRYRKNQKLVLVDEVRKFESGTSGEEAMGDLPLEELVRIVQKLPPQYRMVFNLSVMEGYSHADIGKELGISEGASRSDLSRAREILRNKLSPYGIYNKRKRGMSQYE